MNKLTKQKWIKTYTYYTKPKVKNLMKLLFLKGLFLDRDIFLMKGVLTKRV